MQSGSSSWAWNPLELAALAKSQTAMGRFIGVTIRDRKSLPRAAFLFGLHLFDVASERAR
jgi:hypothetical protein